MSPRTVWLASYPKSGNTWMRAIVTSLGVHPQLFGVNQLGSGAQPYGVGESLTRLGLDPRWLTRAELDRLRTTLVTLTDAGGAGPDGGGEGTDAGGAPRLRKTHERYRPGVSGAEPFPLAATRAAILVVRDPRDVACSFAPFFGTDLDGAIEALGDVGDDGRASPVHCRTAQPWGSWSTHAASWLDPSVPFPVHLVRYEDLRHDAVATLAPVFAAIGLDCTSDQLADAVERASFDRLRSAEDEHGFRETSIKTERFFRQGRSGGWREELSLAQVAALEADHAAMMERLGYGFTTDASARAALAEARASRRRQARRRWSDLPDWLGLEVSEGVVADELGGAERPRPWLQATPTAVRVQFARNNALLVEDGRRVTVQWDAAAEDEGADLSWLVQGWAVTLASLQRGNLSLHASTVRIGGEVVALAGHPGAGKSTTSMALRRRGHDLLVDDTTLIAFDEQGAWVTPYPRNVHLLPDAAAAVGVDFDELPPLAGRLGKAGFLPEVPHSEPVRLDRVVVLTRPPDAGAVSLSEVRGADRVTALAAHLSRRGLAPIVLGRSGYFARLARLAGVVRVQVLARPRNAWTLDAVLDAVEGGAVEEEDVPGRVPMPVDQEA